MKAKKILFFLFLGMTASYLKAQDLLEILDKEQKDTPLYANSTFAFSRISIGHSVETRKTGTLDIFTTNRFWNLPIERTQSFVADRMSSRIALEYGISDRLLFGAGFTTFEERYDAFLKYKLVRERKDGKGWPFSVSLFQNVSYYDRDFSRFGYNETLSERQGFTSQLLIAKKITPQFSLQISPTFIKRGLVFQETDDQDHFAIGFGARFKLGSHVSLVSEYYYVANPVDGINTYGPFSLGVNWELSDVMLQFMMTNTPSMVEDAFIVETRNNFNFKPPNFNFGFNFTYTFHLKNKLRN
ncbi:DUF5777 family beta-barrel protein [Spongiivirga sp. MCCC 1A20706]|uniref:DUF5777 family beta-barrel protein n=1 Tax=Spongiivirga sp. MCCC 1A20706 TaxID=3160963 RepID=UPI0039774FA8